MGPRLENTLKPSTHTFNILCIGQAVSLLGTGMTRFAALIWAYEKTGVAPTLALLGFFVCITYVITIPFILAPYFALWQESVPADVQGRVLAQPFGYLADGVFEPALSAGGALAGPLGWLVGSGPGAGMAAMFLCTSLLGALRPASARRLALRGND